MSEISTEIQDQVPQTDINDPGDVQAPDSDGLPQAAEPSLADLQARLTALEAESAKKDKRISDKDSFITTLQQENRSRQTMLEQLMTQNANLTTVLNQQVQPPESGDPNDFEFENTAPVPQQPQPMADPVARRFIEASARQQVVSTVTAFANRHPDILNNPDRAGRWAYTLQSLGVNPQQLGNIAPDQVYMLNEKLEQAYILAFHNENQVVQNAPAPAPVAAPPAREVPPNAGVAATPGGGLDAGPRYSQVGDVYKTPENLTMKELQERINSGRIKF